MRLRRLHRLVEPVVQLGDEIPGGFDDPGAGPEILLKANRSYLWIAVLEGYDIADRTAPPLVDGLVIVADYAEAGAQVVDQTDQPFLDGVHILIFVHHQVLDAVDQTGAQCFIVAQLSDGLD